MVLADALWPRGYAVDHQPWQGDFAVFQRADLILLRNNWDYHYDLAGFTAWLDRVETAALPIFNPIPLVRWNLHKRYLFDLQVRGVLIPTTRVLAVDAEPEPIFRELGWHEAIIKPLAGASSHLVERVSYDDLAHWSQRVRSQRADGDWLIQEFRSEIQQTGEWSLVFLAGVFSHAVVKQPDPGEFQLNSQYTEQIRRVTPPADLLRQAQQVIATLPTVPLYARVVAILSTQGEFLLLELELNEPSLYFTFAPEQAARFAEIIHDKLG
jgi:glutathione synthase/RimK-type ligase-like ATP-grasp enzyme